MKLQKVAAVGDKNVTIHENAERNFSSFLFHSHDNFELLYFLSGEIEYYIEENSYKLSPGDLLVLPPGKMHRAVVKDQTALYRRMKVDLSVGLANELMRRSPDSFVYQFQNAYCVSMQEVERENYEMLLSHLFALEAEEKLARDSLLTLLLLVIDRALARQKMVAPPAPALQRIQKVIEYINGNLSEDLSLEFLSNKFYISKYHLSRQFKAYTNQTIHTYISEKRMLSAAAQLQEGLLPQQVAENLGFSTYAGFFRAFLQKYGISPSAYRKTK